MSTSAPTAPTAPTAPRRTGTVAPDPAGASGARDAGGGGARRWRLVLATVVGSRLIVLAAGIAGTLLLHRHALPVQIRQTRGLGAVGSLLGASVDRFDAHYYLAIAAHGYGPPPSPRVAFFPLYPLLIRGLSPVVISPVVAGALVSLISFVVGLALLHRLTELELGRRAADATVLLLGVAPLSFFFSAIYTESLFLALSVGTLLAVRTGRPRLAALLGVLATLTRPTGIVLVAPLFIAWRRSGAPRRELGWIVALPAALAAWTVALAGLGFGFTGELRIEHTEWHRVTMFPLETVLVAFVGALRGLVTIAHGGTVYAPAVTGPLSPAAQNLMLAGVLVICLTALEACRRWMRPEYAVYAGLTVLVCLASPERAEPLWCFDRFALTIVPLWMVAGAFLSRRPRWLIAVLAVGVIWLAFDTMQVASWAFIA